MLAELLFIVDLLQRRGLHQTSGRTFDFWRKPRTSQSQQNVVTVATPTPITLTMPVDIGTVDPITAAKDFVAAGTGRPESMKKKMETGRF
jgi:hypothetical protein